MLVPLIFDDRASSGFILQHIGDREPIAAIDPAAAIAYGHNIAHDHGHIHPNNQQRDYQGALAAVLLADQLNQALFGFLPNS